MAEWLDCADASTRLALLKLITGGLRVGVSGRMAKIALAEIGGVEADDVEEVWHGLEPPYLPLFAWLEGKGQSPIRPTRRCSGRRCSPTRWRHPISRRLTRQTGGPMEMGRHRVQLVATTGGRRLYSRGADDISGAFPEIVEAMDFHAVLDGELLVIRDGIVAPFADLQQRLNRKAVSGR